MTLEEFEKRWNRQDFYRKSNRDERGQITYDQHLLEERVISCEKLLQEVRKSQIIQEELNFAIQETLKQIQVRLGISDSV